jgi:Flp pilus assembly protein TadG
MRNCRRRQKGAVIVETALILVPMLFFILGLFEVSRMVWTYHTLTASVKRGSRFAIVHGARFQDASTACPVSVGTIVTTMLSSGIGLDPTKLELQLTSGGQTLSCTASVCRTNATIWPSAPYNAVGLPITIRATYQFDSAVAYILTGTSSSRTPLVAKTSEIIQF